MSQAQIENKVGDYLRNHRRWRILQRPITAEQLQAEMDRIAQHTKQPDVLRELFIALGNDPFVIAECLARPVLVERLITDPHRRTSNKDSLSRGGGDQGAAKQSRWQQYESNYTLPVIAVGPPDARR